jgi:hypothetical protein
MNTWRNGPRIASDVKIRVKLANPIAVVQDGLRVL